MSHHDRKVLQELVDRFLSAYKNRNLDELAGLVWRDPNFTAFGTDRGESWLGWENFRGASEKLFSNVKEIDWKRGSTRIHFSQDGNVAWFSEELAGTFLSGGKRYECPFRMTGVAEWKDGRWQIVQIHRSVPVERCAVPYLETHGVRFD